MNGTCRCCEGIHKITPLNKTNRPGLTGLSYRVGSHASFLETMKACLSNLALTAEDFDGAAGFVNGRPRPLLNLTTRAESDPSIALLDAWAVVADVLGFYQERIANEGFLRTAVERRSILELARLIGYQLRPGVAASVYLAYTLEKDTAVVIPKGARSQSVPGPGELPQSFETADELAARAEWNVLQVRLTQPQVLAIEKPLYFKGIATKLKPNDPLLMSCGALPPALLRVLTVEPDQAAGRTKVMVQNWQRVTTGRIPPARADEAPASATAADPIAQLRETIDRSRRPDAFGVNPMTQTAQRVMAHLDELEKQLESIATDASALDSVRTSLQEEHRLAVEKNFTKLQPWIEGIVSELNQVTATVTETAAAASIAEVLPARSARIAAAEPSSFQRVSGLIGALEKPVSQPPANSLRLDRSVAGNFSPKSDALSRLLVTMRPSLSASLYSAWENLPVTSGQPCRVYALRTRASVFGHNAPLKPIADAKTGRVVGTKEWTLFRDSSASAERFMIITKLNDNRNDNLAFGSISSKTMEVTIFIWDVVRSTGFFTVLGSAAQTVPLTSSTFNVPVPTTDREVVAVTVTESTSQVTVDYQFSNRNLSVKVSRLQLPATADNVPTIWAATSTGSDPTTVTYNTVVPNAVGVLGDFEVGAEPTEEPTKITLDASYKEILPDSWVVLEKPSGLLITQVARVRDASRADYGMAAEGTQLVLGAPWISPGTALQPTGSDGFEIIRGTKVFAQSELLELAEEPVTEPVCGNRLELANLVRGLEPGRSLIVTGERADINSADSAGLPESFGSRFGSKSDSLGFISNPKLELTKAGSPEERKPALPGVMATELVMLAGVEQGYDPRLPGDKTHTTLLLAQELAYCYKRDTITIYGNVVKATHGETKKEVLGSGDGSRRMQEFDLRQSPLTYLPAPTPAGAESTLQVRVNDLLWHETENLIDLGPNDRGYIARTDDADQTKIVFGDGNYGARLPTDVDNVKAVYRTGIGKPGNAKAQQISAPVTRPLGVKSVINPLPATGGADREDRDQARRNAPMAVMALDRLISVQDYEDFARTYAGIARASAVRLTDGRRQIVHLTIAGADDIPIAPTSDLFINLRQALRQFGDPYQQIQIAVRQLKLLLLSAKVRLLPDYQWESVEPKIRAALLKKFGFAERELGQDALASEALSTLQAQAGVAYADLDTFDAVDEDESAADLANLGARLTLNRRVKAHRARIDRHAATPIIRPAQMAYLSPAIADTLILTEIIR